jgi:carboxyl-terminal processing protease
MRRQQLALAGLMWLVAAGLGACGGGSAPTQPAPTVSSPVQDYVEHLVFLMQQHSLRRNSIDWATFRAAVMARAEGARTVVDAYPAIRLSLELLADNHSFYQPVSGNWIFVSTLACAAAEVPVPELPSNVGYIRVPAFSGNSLEASAFARDLQNEIRSADKDDLAGWIVDLRSNGGGNMWPMIAGVGPVLGEGLAGHFVEPNGTESRWGYRHGASWLSDEDAQRVGDAYRLKVPNPRVAVLTDNRSNSSGEATVVAFRQRPNTRSFGGATCGRSTANRAFPLGDGASLYLAVSVMADRTKTMYGNAIVPDEVIADPDEVVRRAVAWLTNGG